MLPFTTTKNTISVTYTSSDNSTGYSGRAYRSTGEYSLTTSTPMVIFSNFSTSLPETVDIFPNTFVGAIGETITSMFQLKNNNNNDSNNITIS